MAENLEQDIFTLEEDEDNRKLDEDLLKEIYDYNIRFFLFMKKSLVIQAPTWRMRDGQEIETYFDEFQKKIHLMQLETLVQTLLMLYNLQYIIEIT